MQGHECGEGKGKPKMGLQSLSQGSQIRARNGEGQAGSRCGVPETETKVCGGTGYAVEDCRLSLGRGDAWTGVPVQCYMECNRKPELMEGTWLQLMCCAPSRLRCPRFQSNRDHGGIPEYTGEDRGD